MIFSKRLKYMFNNEFYETKGRTFSMNIKNLVSKYLKKKVLTIIIVFIIKKYYKNFRR